MSDKPTPPWAAQIPEGSFISYAPTYKVGEYFSRFHKDFFEPAQAGLDFQKMGYYFYDPTEHGYEKGKKYPLLVFMHGTTNALEGDVCINYAGAEFYSKEEYQKLLGGAYLLIPLANEYRDNEGKCQGAWAENYLAPVYELICSFIKVHAQQNGGISKKAVLGNSSGGKMALRLAKNYPEFFNAVVPIGASEIPTEELLDLFDKHNIHLFYAKGKHDEFTDYEKEVAPLLPRFARMKHCYVFIPEWVYNGDHGVASINFGVEMGQHCIINPMHCNLKFDDGTPMDPALPDGVVGWLGNALRKQCFNPYMPSWEYVPDGEPHVFGDRIYVYGSHDQFNGAVFCLGDYICYSAPVTDLTDWRYEGVIYRKDQDPAQDGRMVLYAPDVVQGPDGRYYLYYVFDKVGFVSVAVCDTPAGKYEFYGHVHYADGTRLGDRKGDMPQFDPGVLREGDKTYLYTGFSGRHMIDRIGAMATTLGPDMLTIVEEPVVIIPGDMYVDIKSEADVTTGCPYPLKSIGNWAGFKNHAFFEAPSIRKIGDTYYFVYSSEVMHELCYATSKSPRDNFVYGGVIVSNVDMHIDTYKPADMPVAYGANNHGGFELINGQYYMFYHRHTNGNWYSRQGCAEKMTVNADGSIPQVEITSCGLNGGPLKAQGEYAAYIACHIFNPDKPGPYVGPGQPKITQDGRDGDEEEGYIVDITDKTTIGFKYFDFKDVHKLSLVVRGYMYGGFEIRTKWDGPVLGKLNCESANFWEADTIDIDFPDGTHALYLTWVGGGNAQLKSIRFNL